MNPKIRNIVFLCSLSLVTLQFSSCRPHGVLSSRQMRLVMADLHKTDALLQVSGLQHGHNDAEDIYYALVLEKHGITQAEFDSSLVWYTAHPQLFDKIYPRVMTQLAKEREAFDETHQSAAKPAALSKTQMAPRITAEQARRYTDSITWTIQHPRPVYGWIRGWKELPKESIVPYLQ